MHVLDQAWERVKSDFDEACSQSARAARWELTNDLNQLLRRLRQYQTQSEWASIVVEAASRFVSQAAVLEVTSPGLLKLRAQSNLGLRADLELPVSSAAAFASALSSRDPLVTLRLPSEVSVHFQSSDTEARAHILPIFNGGRIVALLFAAGADYVDVNALEIVTGIASLVLERAENRALHMQVAPAPKAEESVPSRDREGAVIEKNTQQDARPLPGWADLPLDEQSRHIQAQRFARVTVAELQLARPEACRSGRAEGNLYLYLKKDIDRARDTFRKQFMQTPSMVDYLHMELAHSAAAGDESKLGADYPGPLV